MTPIIFGVTITRGLSTTEQAAVDCALKGLTAKEAARHIGCGYTTVQEAYKKLCVDFGAKRTTQVVAAIAVAQAAGMIPEPKRNATNYGPRPKPAPRFEKVSSVWRLAA